MRQGCLCRNSRTLGGRELSAWPILTAREGLAQRGSEGWTQLLEYTQVLVCIGREWDMEDAMFRRRSLGNNTRVMQ